jgi:concentrative nucleoside transporter, CNT family
MDSKDLALNLLSLIGVYAICFIAWLTSENRRNIPWDTIAWGLGTQFIIGFLIFVIPFFGQMIVHLSNALNFLMDASEAGARFVFSEIFVPKKIFPDGTLVGDTPPLNLIDPTSQQLALERLTKAAPNKPGETARMVFDMKATDFGYIFAFRALPQVIFFAGLIGLMYRLNLIQPVVNFLAKVFHRTMNVSGAESLSGSANIFVGIESIVAIKPYLMNMTRSEICAILASCFGSISSSVLAMYAGFLRPTFPSITGHLVSASLLTIPACFVIAKIVVPEDGNPETMGGIPEEVVDPNEKKPSHMDALILGALDGLKMAAGIAAVLIAILGCVEVINMSFASLAGLAKTQVVPEDGALIVGWKYFLMGVGMVFEKVSLNNLFGLLFFPLTFLTGVSFDLSEVWTASILIGQRLLQTSVPPYIALGKMAMAGELSDRTLLIVSYALCGFAHIPSMGIFIGGMTNLIPSRASDISSVAWKSLWAATLATIMTGCIAGIFFFGNGAALGK